MGSKALAPLILALMAPAMSAGAEPPKLEWTLVNAPGIRLTFEETSRSLKSRDSQVCYQLKAEGLPLGETYWMYMHWMDGEIVSMPFGFKLDDQGMVYKDNPGDWKHWCVNGLLRGEAIGCALVSQESGTKASGEVIPFPIEAVGEGGCRIALQLITPANGGTFALFASGFEPGEVTEVVSRSGREVLSSQGNVKEDGTFVHVMLPGVRGKRGGKASVTVTGRACTVSLAYDWGRDMKLQ